MLLYLGLLVALLYLLTLFLDYRATTGIRHATTGKAPPLVGIVSSALALLRSNEFFFLGILKRAEKLGDISLGFLGPFPVVNVTDPKIVQHVIKEHLLFKKPKAIRNPYFDYMIGKVNIVNSDGEQWKPHRVLADPAFKNNSRFVGPIRSCVDDLLASWEGKAGHKVAGDLQTLTLRVLGFCIFGSDLYAEGKLLGPLKDYSYAMENVTSPSMLMNPYHSKMPFESTKKMWAAVKGFRGYVTELVEAAIEAKATPAADGTKNLLELMVAAYGQDELIDKEALINDFGLFFIAGHETTSASLGWAMWLLSTHPDIQLAASEVAKSLPDLENDSILSMKLIPAIIKETMRLYPPAVAVSREAGEDTTIGPYSCPKGTLLNLSLYNASRDPRYWDEPTSFRPSRWFDREAMAKVPRGAYLPFSTGPRVCIGNRFSLLEQKIFLARLLLSYELEPVGATASAQMPAESFGIINTPCREKLTFTFKPRTEN